MESLLRDLAKCRELFRMELTIDERNKVRDKAKEIYRKLLVISGKKAKEKKW